MRISASNESEITKPKHYLAEYTTVVFVSQNIRLRINHSQSHKAKPPREQTKLNVIICDVVNEDRFSSGGCHKVILLKAVTLQTI